MAAVLIKAMIGMIQNVLKKYPKTFFIICLLVVTAVLDTAMARIFWKRLATHPEYYVEGLRCADPFFNEEGNRLIAREFLKWYKSDANDERPKRSLKRK